ncbi:MAG: Crp/Fnr family transcriptional regulator [Acetobacteraceae bacterium]
MARAVDEGLLVGARLFAGVERAELRRIAEAARLVSRPAGGEFFAQGDAATAFFLLVEGRIRITQITSEGQQVALRYIAPGEVFGAVPLFSGGPWPATALAVIDSTAARWSREATDRLTADYPVILANALAIVGERVRQIEDRYRELATERVEQRVAHALLKLAQIPEQSATGAAIDFPISRQDIAELTGTTLHTVSRILSAWEQQGILESRRMHVRIVHPEGVRAIAAERKPTESS